MEWWGPGDGASHSTKSMTQPLAHHPSRPAHASSLCQTLLESPSHPSKSRRAPAWPLLAYLLNPVAAAVAARGSADALVAAQVASSFVALDRGVTEEREGRRAGLGLGTWVPACPGRRARAPAAHPTHTPPTRTPARP